MEGNGHTETTLDLKDANGARLNLTKRKVQLYLGNSYKRATKTTLRKGSIYWVISTNHLHKVAPTMNLQRRDSTKRLEEAGKMASDQDMIHDWYQEPAEVDRAEWYTVDQGSFDKGCIPRDWTDSFLKPIPKPEKDCHKLYGHCIFTMQNTLLWGSRGGWGG